MLQFDSIFFNRLLNHQTGNASATIGLPPNATPKEMVP